MRPSIRRPAELRKLRAQVLAICDQRIKACREAEYRYAAMVRAGGGILGSVELARLSEATERSARMEVEHVRRLIVDMASRDHEPTTCARTRPAGRARRGQLIHGSAH